MKNSLITLLTLLFLSGCSMAPSVEKPPDPAEAKRAQDAANLALLNSLTKEESDKLADLVIAENEERMAKIVTATITKKGFQAHDYKHGIADNSNVLTILYLNKGAKPVRAFQGYWEFLTLFGESFYKFKIDETDGLKPSKPLTVIRSVSYNMFMKDDEKLKETPLKDMKCVWHPVTIMFTDGSVMKSGDQCPKGHLFELARKVKEGQ